jgi:hypothetical protein
MPKEKIGEDVLGSAPPSRMPPKKRKELEERMKEELKRLEEERQRKLMELGIREGEKQKIHQLEDEGKLPKLPIPGELPHEKKLGELGYDNLLEEQKDVHVDEHYRSRPKKKKKQEQKESFFDFP